MKCLCLTKGIGLKVFVVSVIFYSEFVCCGAQFFQAKIRTLLVPDSTFKIKKMEKASQRRGLNCEPLRYGTTVIAYVSFELTIGFTYTLTLSGNFQKMTRVEFSVLESCHSHFT